jgi:hypothetical protein
LEPTPPGSKKIVEHLNHLSASTSEQSISNFSSPLVVVSAAEKRHHLIEDVGGSDDRRKLGR